MKKTVLAIASLVIIGWFIGYAVASEPTPTIESPKPISAYQKPQPPTVEELLRLTNEERSKAGVKPLELNPLLNKSAQMKADEMTTTNNYSHVNQAGKHGYTYISDVGAQCSYGSENINNRMRTSTSQATIASWMSSDAHRTALLDLRYDQFGAAISGDFVVMHFCDL